MSNVVSKNDRWEYIFAVAAASPAGSSEKLKALELMIDKIDEKIEDDPLRARQGALFVSCFAQPETGLKKAADEKIIAIDKYMQARMR